MAKIVRRAVPEIPFGQPLLQNGMISEPWKEWFTTITDSVAFERHTTVTLNPASVPANSEATETVTFNGVTTSDLITVNKPTHTAGLKIIAAYVSAADTVKIVFENTTGSAIDAGSEDYLLVATSL